MYSIEVFSMKKVLVFAVMFLLLVEMVSAIDLIFWSNPRVNGPTRCTNEYKPVCGQNSETYSNACVASSKGVRVQYSGECKKYITSEKPIAEMVKCSFKNANSATRCISKKGGCTGVITRCRGITCKEPISCSVYVKGYKDEKVSWSACGKTLTTKITGEKKEVVFDCAKS